MAYVDPNNPNGQPPAPMFAPGFGQGMQGMFGGLKRGFQAGGQALHPYSNRLLLAGMGLLSRDKDAMGQAMKGLVAGSALDASDADREKLNKAIAALQNDPNNSLFAGMSQPEIDIISSDKDTLGAFVANRTKPASTPNSWDEYTLTTDAPTAAGYNEFLKTRQAGMQINMNPSKWSDVSTMRQDVFKPDTGVSKYKKALPAFNSMVSSMNDTAPGSDYNFIYGMAQIMDPTSNVMGGEIGIVIQGMPLASQLKQKLLQLTAEGGPGLTPAYRRQLIDNARRRVEEYRKQAEDERVMYEGIVQRNPNLDIRDIFPDLPELPRTPAADDGLVVTPAP